MKQGDARSKINLGSSINEAKKYEGLMGVETITKRKEIREESMEF